VLFIIIRDFSKKVGVFYVITNKYYKSNLVESAKLLQIMEVTLLNPSSSLQV